jgi:hypothetical protein
MAFEFQDRDSDAVYRGMTLEFVIDDKKDIGEVYLDGDLIFQDDEIYSEVQLRKEFKNAVEVIEAEPENQETDVIGYDDDLDDEMDDDQMTEEDEDGLEERLFTKGGEYMTTDGREYMGDYHIHPRQGAFMGKFFAPGKPTARLIKMTIEDVQDIRLAGKDPIQVIDYQVDEIIDPDYDDEIIIDEDVDEFY